jgi:hypothetical protein
MFTYTGVHSHTHITGQEFVFGMGSSVDARHADSITLQPGGGSIAMMNSTVVYQCTDMDAVSYLYAHAPLLLRVVVFAL